MTTDSSIDVENDDALASNEPRNVDDETDPRNENDPEMQGYDDVSIAEFLIIEEDDSHMEKLENGSFSENSMVEKEFPILGDDVGASLPTAEEFRTSERVFNKDYSTSELDSGDYSSTKKSRKMNWKIMLVALIVFIVCVSLLVSGKKNKDNATASTSADTEQTNSNQKKNISGGSDKDTDHQRKNSSGVSDKDTDNDLTSFSDGNETFVDIDDLHQIMSYFSSTYGISKIADVGSSQYQAALWFAANNQPTLFIPGSSNGSSKMDSPEYKYRYLAKYVMAIVYYSLNGEEWAHNLDFLSPNTDICTWLYSVATFLGDVSLSGIFCDDATGFPVALLLPDLNVTGTIPSELGLLTTLKAIDIGRNDVAGSIPTELCNLGSLQLFSAIYNRIEGKIPECIGNTKNLTKLYLSSNNLDGSIPTSVGSLSLLTDLYIDDNMLTGNPVGIWEKLTNLVHLQAFSNEFTGDIRTLFSPTIHDELKILDLSDNNFTSPLGFPKHLFNMPSLLVIDLSNNQLSGSIPTITTKNEILLHLALYGNKINGTLPAGIAYLSNCTHLDVSINKLTGPIPSEIGQMTPLTYLFLSDNPGFQAGPIPKSFANLTKLSELSLRNTNRTGSLPSFVHKFTELELLDLSKNKFAGEIPVSWNNLRSVEYLLMNDNPAVNGSIAAVLKNLTSLRAGFIDGTAIVSNLTGLCPSLQKKASDGEVKVLFADCGGHRPTVTCECCQCCDVKNEKGCSSPMLSNLDLIWDTYYRRSFYRFSNNTVYIDSDIAIIAP